jgi:hypothetical protein
MNIGMQVQVSALVECLSPQDMPRVAAAILDAWCAKSGASQESITDFVSCMVEAEGDHETRQVLGEMLCKYETGWALESHARPRSDG